MVDLSLGKVNRRLNMVDYLLYFFDIAPQVLPFVSIVQTQGHNYDYYDTMLIDIYKFMANAT